jgi:hypothetical protein
LPNSSSQKFTQKLKEEKRTRSLSIPLVYDIADGSNWEMDDRRQEFFLVRFNCVVKEVSGKPRERYESLASVAKGRNQLASDVTQLKARIEDVDENSLVRDTFFSPIVAATVGDMLMGAGATGELGIEGRRVALRKVRDFLVESTRSLAEVIDPPTRESSRTFDLTEGEASSEDAAVYLRFEQRHLNVYLEYVDFLRVRYHLYWGQTRWRREKWPIRELNGTVNELRMKGQPLGTLSYYVPAGLHLDRPSDPNLIGSARSATLAPLRGRTSAGRRLYEDAPTLYALSNVAFPVNESELELKPELLEHLRQDPTLADREQGFVFSLHPQVRRRLAQEARKRRRRR